MVSAPEKGGGAAAAGASGVAGGWGVVPEKDQLTVEKVKNEFRATFGHWTRYVLNMDWLEGFPGSVRDIENVDVLGELRTLHLHAFFVSAVSCGNYKLLSSMMTHSAVFLGGS